MSRLIRRKTPIFLPYSHLTHSLRGNTFEFLYEPYIAKTRVLGLSGSEDFVILAYVVLTQSQRVTDDRRTDGHVVDS